MVHILRIAVGIDRLHDGAVDGDFGDGLAVRSGHAIERIIHRECDLDRDRLAVRVLLALVDEIEAVIEELAEEDEEAVRGRNAGVEAADEMIVLAVGSGKAGLRVHLAEAAIGNRLELTPGENLGGLLAIVTVVDFVDRVIGRIRVRRRAIGKELVIGPGIIGHTSRGREPADHARRVVDHVLDVDGAAIGSGRVALGISTKGMLDSVVLVRQRVVSGKAVECAIQFTARQRDRVRRRGENVGRGSSADQINRLAGRGVALPARRHRHIGGELGVVLRRDGRIGARGGLGLGDGGMVAILHADLRHAVGGRNRIDTIDDRKIGHRVDTVHRTISGGRIDRRAIHSGVGDGSGRRSVADVNE